MHDIFLTIGGSGIIALAISVILVIIAFISYQGNLLAVINFTRSGLLIIGSLGMFVGALLLLMKKETVSKLGKESWKKHFYAINYFGVVMIFSCVVIAFASIVDFLLFI